MNDVEQPQNFVSMAQQFNNAAYAATSALQIRLNTEVITAEFEMYLKGKQVRYYENENGETVQEVLWEGNPIVNNLGQQSIMQLMRGIISNPSVQGNLTDANMYADYICRCRKDLATDLMINRRRFNLDIKDYSGLMSRMMRIIEIFMTRQIDNKERESYAASMRIQESLQTGNRGGSLFGIGGKK